MTFFIQDKLLMDQQDVMHRAITLSEKSVRAGGGLLGAMVAKDGEIIVEASNTTTLNCDSTAHAEVNAIRQVAHKPSTSDLTGCDIYTSCEPCPMRLGVIYWAHLDRVYYANNRRNATRVGFDGDFIHHEIAFQPADRHKQMQILLPEEARKVFDMWMESKDKTAY